MTTYLSSKSKEVLKGLIVQGFTFKITPVLFDLEVYNN